MPTEIIHFSISGEFITHHSRCLWSELECEKALNFLRSVHDGITDEIAYEILQGKKKLIGINDLEIVDDDVTEIKGVPLLSPIEIIEEQKRRLEKEKQQHQDDLAVSRILNGDVEAYQGVGSPWGLLKAPLHVVTRSSKPSGFSVLAIDYDEFEERFPGLVELAEKERETRKWLNNAYNNKKEKYMDRSIAAIAESIVPGAGALYEEVTVELGTHKDRCGWLLPDGKFYKCRWFQHDGLVEALGKQVKDIEDIWVRISHPSDSPSGDDNLPPCRIYGMKRLTKKQVNFIWDYCLHHGFEYPDDAIKEIVGY